MPTPKAATFLQRPASPTSDKKKKPYFVEINFVRGRLFFFLFCSSLLCLRGSRSNRSLNNSCLRQESLLLVA